MEEDRVCTGCGVGESDAVLSGCPSCARRFCGDCGVRLKGRRFCTQRCAAVMFYGDENDSDFEE